MTIKLYKNGKVVNRTTKHVPTRLSAYLQKRSASEWTSGELVVWYDRTKNYWNKGRFNTLAEFSELLSQFTELALIKEFGGAK